LTFGAAYGFRQIDVTGKQTDTNGLACNSTSRPPNTRKYDDFALEYIIGDREFSTTPAYKID
jgi:hypothetical protein